MTQGAIRWLARLVLTSLMIASLVLAGVNLATLARAPAGAAFVERSTAGIEAATERALLVHATPDTITTRLTSLLTEEPRNWFAIEAVESLAAERALSLPVDLRHKRAAAWEQDNGFWQSAGECARCAWDARTCELSTILMCRAPVDLSPLGDLAGVIRGGLAYLAGRDVDEVDVILSAIGLTAVALAVWTSGSSLAIKAGAGLGKLAKSMNRLPDAVTRPLVRAFREGVEWNGIARVRSVDDLPRLYRPEIMRPAVIIAEDAGHLVSRTSILGALHLMRYVDDPADLSRMARASDALGPRMVGTIEVLGKSRLMRLTMRVADEVWLLATGLIGALAALLGLLQSALSTGLLRLTRRLAQAPSSR